MARCGCGSRRCRTAFHFCTTCGCTTHWTPVDEKRLRLGSNARLLDRAALAGVPIRRHPPRTGAAGAPDFR